MRSADGFSTYHPSVNFLYFGLVIAFSMFFMDPVSLAVSFCAALIYLVKLRGGAAVLKTLTRLFPLMLAAALINAAFNHEGVTILRYLPGGNPLTLESIVYGLAAAAMLGAVILWFSCYSDVMTSDKFVYLFGRIIPALSLVLSMTLRFIPRFRQQFQAVSEARRSLKGETSGGLFAKIKEGVTVLSAVTTWSLENSIETADSMRSRGYGLPGRTAFSIYRFTKRDGAALAWLCFCGAAIIAGRIAGVLDFNYYPALTRVYPTPLWACFTLVYLALCLTPALIDFKEDRRWKRS